MLLLKAYQLNVGDILIVCLRQDEELARQLVELGYRGSGEVLKRDEFEARLWPASRHARTRTSE